MAANTNGDALIIEGIVVATSNGTGGIDALEVVEQLERARSYALGLNDTLEILLGRRPTTAEIRAEWRQMKHKGAV